MTEQKTPEPLDFLEDRIKKRGKRIVLPFREFLEGVKITPRKFLRSIFQLFDDMVRNYVGDGVNEYLDDPESIGYLNYDTTELFVDGADNPFFPDRLFINRFMRQTRSLGQGARQNQLQVYLGPHGCGKSTFLNNLLRSFQRYANSEEGRSFEIFWKIKLGNKKEIEVPCPSHDHPILIIPREDRLDFLRNLLPEEEFKDITSKKEYEWVLKGEVCTICESIFWNLVDRLNSNSSNSATIWDMLQTRTCLFDRRLGEGISVFNPGDATAKANPMMIAMGPVSKKTSSDAQIQESLDEIFGSGTVKYIYSTHARTNNGVYALMDVKGDNKDRLSELHNVITEGVRRVGDIEERVNSLFIALMNPEDKDALEEEKTDRFEGRIQEHSISYVLDVNTEVEIYYSIFGRQIRQTFLPGVLDNFARVIIASRMMEDCDLLLDWLDNLSKYEGYCDESGLLLRMSIYSGVIPSWLLDGDRKKFKAKVRRDIINFGEKEGQKGFDGRESIKLFGDFLSYCNNRQEQRLTRMRDVVEFFKEKIERKKRNEHIPSGFMEALVNWYDYTVLGEVSEALYFYNEEQIGEDILHYLCAINHNIDGSKIECSYTGKEVEVTINFIRTIGIYLFGGELDEEEAIDYAEQIQERYARVLVKEAETDIKETELFQELFGDYVKNLKERVLQPFFDNENFWDAIKAFPDGQEFKAVDVRIQEYIQHLMTGLQEKFHYTEEGAKEICLYVKENEIPQKFGY